MQPLYPITVTGFGTGSKYQMRILPEHGPGAVARTARQRHSTPPPAALGTAVPDVEVRDLAVYEALVAQEAAR